MERSDRGQCGRTIRGTEWIRSLGRRLCEIRNDVIVDNPDRVVRCRCDQIILAALRPFLVDVVVLRTGHRAPGDGIELALDRDIVCDATRIAGNRFLTVEVNGRDEVSIAEFCTFDSGRDNRRGTWRIDRAFIHDDIEIPIIIRSSRQVARAPCRVPQANLIFKLIVLDLEDVGCGVGRRHFVNRRARQVHKSIRVCIVQRCIEIGSEDPLPGAVQQLKGVRGFIRYRVHITGGNGNSVARYTVQHQLVSIAVSVGGYRERVVRGIRRSDQRNADDGLLSGCGEHRAPVSMEASIPGPQFNHQGFAVSADEGNQPSPTVGLRGLDELRAGTAHQGSVRPNGEVLAQSQSHRVFLKVYATEQFLVDLTPGKGVPGFAFICDCHYRSTVQEGA